MRGQTLQISGAQVPTAFLATLDDDVSIDVLGWAGQTTPITLAPDHAAQPHLIEGDRVVRIVVGEADDDVEGHTLTLHFPNAEEAARFRTKVLAGAVLIGAVAAPTAVLASQLASSSGAAAEPAPIVVQQAVPVEAPVVSQPAAAPAAAPAEAPTPAKPEFKLQSKGTSGPTGEDIRQGSSMMWITANNELR